jgi:hypothetical protein
METTEPAEQLLTTPAIPPTVNRDLLGKLQATPYVYIRENLCLGCCTSSFSVYTAGMVVQNYGELSELLYTVKDENCFDICIPSCARLVFYSPDNTQQVWFTYPDCCETCFLCKLCKCDCKDCCKCGCPEMCYRYSPPLIGYYGNTKDVRVGQVRRQYFCIPFCFPPTWTIYNKSDEETLKVKLSCYDNINPFSRFCKIFFDIYRGEQILGQLSRSPKCLCSGYTYEIQFPTDTTVEDRLMMIALCCKAP